jgi:hypothetical protein
VHTGQCHCNLLYGGDDNDHLDALDTKEEGRDKLYCGDGWDKYRADPNDYVSSSCEKGTPWEDGKLYDTGGRPFILLAGAALLSIGLLLVRYVIRRASYLLL